MLKKLTFSFILLTFLIACSKGDGTSPPAPEMLDTKEEAKPFQKEMKENTIPSPSTGTEIEEETYPHFAAVIENSPQARPQSGLAQADIVFEMKTEGNVSRYLAFFHDELPEKVGPIRSARHYFLHFPTMFQTPFIHYGGSPQAYEDLAMMNVFHIDGMTNETVFSRNYNRPAPHNAYVDPDQLSLSQEERFKPLFDYAKETSSSGTTGATATDISFAYNGFTSIRYEWDEEKEGYIRYQEGERQQDQDNGEVVVAHNIIFLEAPHSLLPGDSANRIDINFSGGGELTFISGGESQTGTWLNENGNLVIRDEYNKEIELTPGKTWVQVVEPSASIQMNEL